MSVDVNYFSFSPPRADKKWENFVRDVSRWRANRNLNSPPRSDYLVYGDVFDRKQLILALKFLDIYYGSVSNTDFESPKEEYDMLESLIYVFHLKTEDNLPARDEWIRLFQSLDNRSIKQAAGRLMEFGWDNEEMARAELREYLRAVHPVVKDLKENPDAVFVSSYGGVDVVEPKSAEALLTWRANARAERYRGLLPPVL